MIVELALTFAMIGNPAFEQERPTLETIKMEFAAPTQAQAGRMCESALDDMISSMDGHAALNGLDMTVVSAGCYLTLED